MLRYTLGGAEARKGFALLLRPFVSPSIWAQKTLIPAPPSPRAAQRLARRCTAEGPLRGV
jgi:hypothetical protein